MRVSISKEGDTGRPAEFNLTGHPVGADLIQASSLPAAYGTFTYLGETYSRREFNDVELLDGTTAYAAAAKATNGR